MRQHAAKHRNKAAAEHPRLNKFATDQRRRKGRQCPLGAVLARPTGNPARKRIQLDQQHVMNHKAGFQQTPQTVSVLLNLMLAHWIAVGRKLSLKWCVTWGTLLGCYRGSAMLGHDYDVDVTLFVDSAAEFWTDTFPQLAYYFSTRGFRFVRANLRYAKIMAGDCGKSADWFELKAASARSCADRPTIIRDAVDIRRAGTFVDAQTPHVVDVLVAASPDFQEGPHKMCKNKLLPFVMKPFASLRVPTPAHSERVLDLWYGPGWKTEKLFKDPVTYKMCPVPFNAKASSWPSPTIAELLKTIVA